MPRKYVPVPVSDHEQGLERAVDGENNVPESYIISWVELGPQLLAKNSGGVGLQSCATEPLEDVPSGAKDEHDVETEIPVEVAIDSAPLEMQE